MADTNPPSSNSNVNPISGGSYVGDSIAVRIGAASGQGGIASDQKTGTGSSHATVGYDTNKILSSYKGQSGSRYTVISAGTNDQGGQKTESNLRALRASFNSPKVIWIVPYTKQSNGKPEQAVLANMQKAAALVRKVAAEKNDPVIELDNYPTSDGLHPDMGAKGTGAIVEKIKGIVGGVAGGDTPTATDGATPTTGGDSTPDSNYGGCDQGDGSPNFTAGEGSDSVPATASGDPLPPAKGLKPTNKEYITNQELPPIPKNIDYNNAAKSIRLSHYYTLYDVLHTRCGGAVIPMGGKTHCNRRWSAYELVSNLRELAVLCLDPIKHKYPYMAINSCFRNGTVPGGGSSTSAHDVGWAADMVFYPNYPNGSGTLIRVAEDIAKFVPYDQLLYEFAPDRQPRGTSEPWVHIGIRAPSSPGGRAPLARTFWNDHGIGTAGSFCQFPRLKK